MKGKAQFQQALAGESSFEKYARKSRREECLNLMESVVPWRELEAVIELDYPKAGNDRRRVGLLIGLVIPDPVAMGLLPSRTKPRFA